MGTWIGITKDTNKKWKWANGANMTYGWAENQPTGNGVCGCIRRDTGGYNDYNCSAVRQFFCEYELSNLPIKATKLPSPCPPGWDYYDFSCYKFVDHEQGQMYSQAQAACSTLKVGDKTAHLANIQTSDEYYYAYSYFETLDKFHVEIGVWVGLRLADEHWVWGDGTKMTADTVRLWAPDEPSDHGPCGSIHKETGGFSAAACDHVKQYLCEAELDRPETPKPTSRKPCKTGWVHRDASCYSFHGKEEVLPRDKAAANCSARHEGATLVNLETTSEYEWIQEEIAYRGGEFDNKKYGTWVGLMRSSDDKDVWEWSNGQPLTYDNKWAKDNPSSETDMCVTMRRESSGLNDHGCDHAEQFICEYEDEGFGEQVNESSVHKDIVILGVIVIVAVIIIAVAFAIRGYRKYCIKNRGVTVKYSDMRTNQPEAYTDVRITENPREYRDDTTAVYRDQPETF
ncbi:macrophage mannose receptor 1-like isoform X2 [Ptychodera flava]